MKGRYGAFVLLATALLLWLSLSPPARAGAPASTSHRLYIVFLPGLCGPIADPHCSGAGNAAARGRATFATLIAALRAARVSYTPVFYGYNRSHPATYSAADTHQSLQLSVAALAHQIASVREKDATAHIDLVGHSLGGVIAASWAVADARKSGSQRLRGVRAYLHSIVTLDSPLRGIQARDLGALLSQVFGGVVWLDLRSDSAAIRRITALPNSWWRSAHLHSVANRADIIVPPREALLGFEKTVTDSRCSRDLVVLSSCHGAVLADSALETFVACHWITNDQQCITTPTPTVTPTPTATPSPTPSPLPTATPAPTATGTGGPPSPP